MADVAFAPTHSFTMDTNKSVTANFIAGVKITVNKNGQGTVSPGTGVYFASANLRPMGGTKTLTATPASGWRWSHWEGNLGGADGGDPSLDLPMDQARTITAVFVEQVTLTVVKELIGNLPAEGGSVSPAVGETLQDKDSVVNLVATPEVVADPPQAGWRFKQWSGAASGTNPSTTVTMSGDKTVTATFIQVHTVTTEAIAQGVIEPEGGTYDHGATQSFFFDRQSGHQFHHWAGLPSSFSTPAWGPGTSTSNPVNVTIEQSLHIIGYDDEIIYTLTADVAAEGCTGCTVDPPVAEYIEGDPGTVTATPGEGWGFVRWEGNVPAEMVEDNPLVMPMDGDKAVTAVFGQVTLTMDTEEGGTVDPDVGVHYYAQGDLAFITATADEGWKFDHWEGNVPSADIRVNPLDLEMNDDKDVTAVFQVRLDVEAPTTVIVEIPNLFSPNWQWYMPGDTVELKATPLDDNHVVAFWEVTTFYPASGESDGNGKALSGGSGGPIDNKTIYPGNHAVFSIKYPSLAVPIVREVGQFYLLVESQWEEGESVGHINVSAAVEMPAVPVDLGHGRMLYSFNEFVDAEAEPPQHVQVTLEAVPDEPGWAFDEWSGDIVPFAPDANPISLTLDEDKQVIASFTNALYLTIQVEGEGGVSVDPDKDVYDVGEEVDLVADPADGWMFDHWEGDVLGDEISKTIPMDDDKDVVAVFVPMHLVSVEVRGEGEVTPSDAPYEDGEEQSFTHLPALSSDPPPFHHWEGLPEDQYPDGPVGPGSSSQNPVTITIHDSYHLIAVEGPAVYTLEVTTEGQGTVEPEEGTYPSGSTVSIVPTSADCTWFFDHWEGDLGGSDIPGKIEMDEDKEVVAVFTQDPQIQVKQGDRFIRESSSDSDGDGLPDDLATIGPSPSMPELTAQLKNVSASCSVKWKIAVEYSRANVPSTENMFDTYYYPRDGAGNPAFSNAIPANQPWTIVFDQGFLGGDAKITYELNGTESEFQFRIGGLNPDDAIAKAFIVGNSGVHWYAYAIARKESRVWSNVLNAPTYYNQFNPPGSQYGHFYEPLKDESEEENDGFGMMMVDPPDNRNQLWHWKLNVLEGMERLDVKRWGPKGANDWLLRQIAQQQEEAPAKELRFEVFTYSDVDFQEGTARTPLDACTIQAFNGVPAWTISWNKGSDEWEQKASSYVDAVCAELEE